MQEELWRQYELETNALDGVVTGSVLGKLLNTVMKLSEGTGG